MRGAGRRGGFGRVPMSSVDVECRGGGAARRPAPRAVVCGFARRRLRSVTTGMAEGPGDEQPLQAAGLARAVHPEHRIPPGRTMPRDSPLGRAERGQDRHGFGLRG